MDPSPTAGKKPLYKSLYLQVLTAIVIGVLVGHFYPSTGEAMKPLGDGFIKLIKMIIAPIIFCTVVTGIAGMEDMKKVGKTGGYALLYFEVVSSVALLIGLLIVNFVQPGSRHEHRPRHASTRSRIAAYAEARCAHVRAQSDFILNIIPSTVVDAFATGEILQVLLFAVLFGFALHKLGGRGTLVFDLIEKVSQVLFAIVGAIMRVAPIGAFGAMAFTIGKYGLKSLLSLGALMATFYTTCLVFVIVVLGAVIAWLCTASAIFKFIRYIKEELLIVLGTSSSESVLPRMIAKMENLGVQKSTVGLVIPTGYSFNLDGTSIYLTMAAVFIAQATTRAHDAGPGDDAARRAGADLEGRIGRDRQRVHRAGRHAVGSSATCPVEGLALILGIDRFMSEARALTNLVGNGVATVVVGKWCGELDSGRMNRVLNRETRRGSRRARGGARPPGGTHEQQPCMKLPRARLIDEDAGDGLHRIVVVGGGAGGLELATRLGDTLGKRRKAHVTLIEKARTHFWKPAPARDRGRHDGHGPVPDQLSRAIALASLPIPQRRGDPHRSRGACRAPRPADR